MLGEGLSLGRPQPEVGGAAGNFGVVVLGSKQGVCEEGALWLLWRHSCGRKDTPWVSAGKLKQRMASRGLVWAPLLCLTVTIQEGQL